ncbi:hypothetical protein JW964_21195 [candidate division KSB1 bacterium]|nr:hypothetical protein [candidate division KSB1 bacterium]
MKDRIKEQKNDNNTSKANSDASLLIKPWELSANLTAVDLNPFFDDEYCYSLSMVDVKPNSTHCYKLGSAIANLNSAGIVVGNLHPGNYGINLSTGGVIILDFGDVIMNAEVHPELMMNQLLFMYGSHEIDDFLAILSGYTHESFQVLDLKYPNFTHELLNLIGGKITSLPEHRSSTIDIDQIFSKLGINIDLANKVVKVESINFKPELWINESQGIFLLFASLIFLGIDCSPIFLNRKEIIKSFNIENNPYTLLHNFYANNLKYQNGFCRDHKCEIAAQLLVTLQEKHTSALNRSDLDFLLDFSIVEELKLVLKSCSSNEAIEFINGLIDVSDYLAIELDKKWISSINNKCFKMSVRFAQFSQILLQLTITNCRETESRLSLVESRHRKLSWKKMPSDAKNADNLFMHAMYLDTITGTYFKIFEKSISEFSSGTEQFPIISLGWDCLNQSREALKSAHKVFGLKTVKIISKDEFPQIVYLAVKHYYKCLHALRDATLLSAQKGFFTCWANFWTGTQKSRQFSLGDESAWAEAFLHFLQKGKLDSIRGRFKFGRGIKIIEKIH